MGELYVEINDIEKKYYKRKPKLSMVLEFDLSYLQINRNHSDGAGQLQTNPLELIVMDRQTGEIIAQDIFSIAKTPKHCQVIFWEVLRALPNRLVKIHVSKEMKSMLFPLEALLELEFVESELPTIEEYRSFNKSRSELQE